MEEYMRGWPSLLEFCGIAKVKPNFFASLLFLFVTMNGCGGSGSSYASPDTTPPTAPTSWAATAASGTQINLSWTASTDNVGVTGYRVERCQGAGCNNFAQIATPAANAFGDSGLTASTSYSYRIRATDAAGNISGYSNTATATTQAAADNTPPTAPTNLTAVAASSAQITLSWTASTDNVGVTGYRVERCQGAGCNNFAQIATPTANAFNDAGLTTSTSYGYRVRCHGCRGQSERLFEHRFGRIHDFKHYRLDSSKARRCHYLPISTVLSKRIWHANDRRELACRWHAEWKRNGRNHHERPIQTWHSCWKPHDYRPERRRRHYEQCSNNRGN